MFLPGCQTPSESPSDLVKQPKTANAGLFLLDVIAAVAWVFSKLYPSGGLEMGFISLGFRRHPLLHTFPSKTHLTHQSITTHLPRIKLFFKNMPVWFFFLFFHLTCSTDAKSVVFITCGLLDLLTPHMRGALLGANSTAIWGAQQVITNGSQKERGWLSWHIAEQLGVVCDLPNPLPAVYTVNSARPLSALPWGPWPRRLWNTVIRARHEQKR